MSFPRCPPMITNSFRMSKMPSLNPCQELRQQVSQSLDHSFHHIIPCSETFMRLLTAERTRPFLHNLGSKALYSLTSLHPLPMSIFLAHHFAQGGIHDTWTHTLAWQLPLTMHKLFNLSFKTLLEKDLLLTRIWQVSIKYWPDTSKI